MNKINYFAIGLFFCYASITTPQAHTHTSTCSHAHSQDKQACVQQQEPINEYETLELILPGEQRAMPATISPDIDDTASTTTQPDEWTLIDKIDVIIGTENKTTIITHSQINLPSLDGSPRTKNDLINEVLMYQEAIKTQPPTDEETIDKMLKQIQRENNISLEQLKTIFENAEYTFQEGREQFGIMSAINMLLDFKVRSRLSITDAEIKLYYDQNPVMQPATYYVERVFIPFDSEMTPEEQRAHIMLLTPRERSKLSWSRPFAITKEQLAEEKQFIVSLEIGAISEPYELENGFELFKMKTKLDRTAVPLEDRYNEIANILRKERYEKLMSELQEKLLSEASIIEL